MTHIYFNLRIKTVAIMRSNSIVIYVSESNIVFLVQMRWTFLLLRNLNKTLYALPPDELKLVFDNWHLCEK